MSNQQDDILADALEDIAHLARSGNRVRILEALADRPHTRRELKEATGIPRSTVGRITMELEDRGWVEQTAAGDYEATVTGDHMMSGFLPFAESVAAIRQLGDAVEWLPLDELDIDLRHFSDAVVKRSDHDDPMEVIDYLTDIVADASDVRVLTHFAPPEPFAEAVHERLHAGQMTGKFVMTEAVFKHLCDRPSRRDRWRENLEAGAEAYRYEGEVPCNLVVIDDTVFIKSSRPESVQRSYGAPIVSRNDTVRSWAYDLVETYRNRAVRIDPETLSSPQTE